VDDAFKVWQKWNYKVELGQQDYNPANIADSAVCELYAADK
jgi:hypothetical protein